MSIEQTSGLILPTDPEQRQKIKMGIKEICNAKTRIQSEKDHIKNTVEDLSKEHDLPKPAINKIAAWYYKQDLLASVGQVEDAQDLYETIFGVEEEGQE